jgi:ribonuclease J
MIEIAVQTGQLTDFPTTVPEDRTKDIPAEHLFYLVTGSQGEARAALARIAAGTHPTVSLFEGDTVIFSSKNIPGNESGIYRVHNRLSERGVRIVDADMERIHVSGHARRGDLERIYAALKPKVAIPVHGEHRHLVEHASCARRWGAAVAILAPNGTMVRLDGNTPGPVEHVENGRIYIDGTAEIGAFDGVIRERLKMAREGHIVCALVIDDEGELLADPEVRCLGAPKDGPGWTTPLNEMIAEAVDDAIEDMPAKARRADAGIEEVARRAIRRIAGKQWGKRPIVTVLISRLEE